tara:strand:- start:253 stop:441 length:189 start_codon:yes stop_codon:yes gene_type:complete
MKIQELYNELTKDIPLCPLCDNNHVDVDVCDHQAVYHVCDCVDVGVKKVIHNIITKYGGQNG